MAKQLAPLWLVEYYTKGGDIQFAWVRAKDGNAALALLKKLPRDFRGMPIDFEEMITINEQAEITRLAMDKPPRFLA